MSAIKLNYDDAIGYADDINKSKADAFQILSDLHGRILNLTDSFEGATQVAFLDRIAEWDTQNTELGDALDELGKFLRNAANTIKDVDDQLANQISG